MARWQIWNFNKNNKHHWAFYYFCKRQGDKVYLSETKTKLLVRIKE